MALKLFDSLTRSVQELRPSHPDGVFRFYNCGPTVYAPAHIGNFRTFAVNDLIRRLLELELGADRVKHVRNLTDVDDRTIGQAKKEGRPLDDITAHWTKIFHEDCAALNLLPPHAEPTATGHIREQVDMIEVLMRKGNAYRAPDGSVYFKLDSFPGYGALSRIKERELRVTNMVADSDHKDAVSDFALWKAYKPQDDGDVKWTGPEGSVGRPGWHIECSAMSKKLLGDTIDLHTGGVDLLFPHHENEIAQSECCNGVPFSRHWYHSEHLLVEGTTMSKSKGNYYTLRDLVAKGYSPMAVRYALLAGHPRKQLNFTLDSLHAAEKALNSLRTQISFFCDRAGVSFAEFCQLARNPKPYKNAKWWHTTQIRDALAADLNTPSALGEIFSRLIQVRQGMLSPSIHSKEDMREFIAGLANVMFALGLDLTASAPAPAEAPAEVVALAEKRWAAKQAKDFKTADALRADIAATGWQMLDRKDGYSLQPADKR